jgi:broad specificity phosphatase PhoE
MKSLILTLVLLGIFATALAAQPTIFIVRHAEKAASTGRDPELTVAGRARAESLARALRDAGITLIYVTDLRRTQQTAAPLAKALGIKPTVLPPNDTAALSTRLREVHSGNVLVVGHSDTVPEIIKELGIATSIHINDTDYDNLFVVLLEAQPRLIRLHYR